MSDESLVDEAVESVVGILGQLRDEALARGEIVSRHFPEVVDIGMTFQDLTSSQRPDLVGWAESADFENCAVREQLARAAQAMIAVAKVPYGHDPSGWQLVNAIGIAMASYDFSADALFSLEAIQWRMKECLLRDCFVTRTIYGLAGVSAAAPMTLTQGIALIPPTKGRRSHIADPSHPTYPMIHCSAYLMSESAMSISQLREGKRDALVSSAIASIRAVCRLDMQSFGPWVEFQIMRPEAFANFKTYSELPRLPLSYSLPGEPVLLRPSDMQESAKLIGLLANPNVSGPLSQASRSLSLAVDRASVAVDRQSLRDAILDLMIALEASLANGEKTELTYRIGLRAAYLFDGSAARSETRAFVQKAYGIRSDIVHGAKREPEISQQLIQRLREIVRGAIRLNALSLARGSLLVDQIERAIIGDDVGLNDVKALLSADLGAAATPVPESQA